MNRKAAKNAKKNLEKAFADFTVSRYIAVIIQPYSTQKSPEFMSHRTRQGIRPFVVFVMKKALPIGRQGIRCLPPTPCRYRTRVL